jgi:hypothetical protein
MSIDNSINEGDEHCSTENADVETAEHSDTSATVASCSSESGSTSRAKEFQFPSTFGNKKGKGKRRIDDDQSGIDKSINALTQYFTAKTSAVTQNEPTNVTPDEDALFGSMISAELKKLRKRE